MAEQSIDIPAEESSNEAQELAERGRQLYRHGDLDEALTFLHQAYGAYKDSGNQSGVAEAANDLGVLFTVMQRFSEAETWLREAHRLFVDAQDYDGEAQTLGNLGSMYEAQGDLKQAAANLQQASDRFHLVGDDERRSATLKVLSKVRLRQFRLLQALAAFEAALACQPNPSAFSRFLERLFSLPRRLLGQ
jgi:tetratricopeptide (TPR) repeat protein